MTESSATSVSLETAVMRMLDRLSKRERTQHTYDTGLTAFIEFAAEQEPAVETIDDLYPSILADFYLWLTDRYASLTIRTYLAAVRAFLRHLRAHDALDFDTDKAAAALKETMSMGDRLRYPAVEHTPELPTIVTYYDNVEQLPAPDSASNRQTILVQYRNRAILYTLFSTAGRLSEILELTRADVQNGRAKRVMVVGKRDKQRVLFLSEEARVAIRDYLQKRDEFGERGRYLFISHGRNKGSQLSSQSVWRVVKKAARAHDLDHISPHTFRHWRATQMLNDGVPAEIVKDLLGHEQITTTTTIYARYLTGTLEEAFDKHTPTVREAQEQADRDT